MSRERVIVLFNPIHPYAVRFLELAHRRGMRTVVLWTNLDKRSGTWRFPVLRSRAVAANLTVGTDPVALGAVAEHLAGHYEVAAVVPHNEEAVEWCIVLATHLGHSWAQPEVMSRFRDKHALKRHLASVPGGPRINRVALVASVADVRAAMAEHDLDRVVIKPNDGFGNVAIAFVDRATPDEEVAAHLARSKQPMLLEERLEGFECFANGQVNAEGHVDITRVGTYVRAALNGRPNVEIAERATRTSEPHFRTVADYATEVMVASGARRTPFHLECFVTPDGASLVEVGARLAGGDHTIDSRLHGTDIVEAALEQYLDDGSAATVALDWRRHDAEVVGLVSGWSDRHGRIAAVRGVDRAEAMPGFLRWDSPPTTGNVVVPTVDLFGTPWDALLAAPDVETWLERSAALRATVELLVVPHDSRNPWLQLRAHAPRFPRTARRAWSVLATRR